jgi:anti-anti-sigma factor
MKHFGHVLALSKGAAAFRAEMSLRRAIHGRFYMNTSFYETQEEVVLAAVHSTELVRGDEQQLLQRFEPLVREKSIELDLRNIDRIDAAGISTLIALYIKARNAGHAFSVCNASPRVSGILKLVGLESILMSHNTVQASHSECRFERSAA